MSEDAKPEEPAKPKLEPIDWDAVERAIRRDLNRWYTSTEGDLTTRCTPLKGAP